MACKLKCLYSSIYYVPIYKCICIYYQQTRGAILGAFSSVIALIFEADESVTNPLLVETSVVDLIVSADVTDMISMICIDNCAVHCNVTLRLLHQIVSIAISHKREDYEPTISTDQILQCLKMILTHKNDNAAIQQCHKVLNKMRDGHYITNKDIKSITVETMERTMRKRKKSARLSRLSIANASFTDLFSDGALR